MERSRPNEVSEAENGPEKRFPMRKSALRLTRSERLGTGMCSTFDLKPSVATSRGPRGLCPSLYLRRRRVWRGGGWRCGWGKRSVRRRMCRLRVQCGRGRQPLDQCRGRDRC
jgi:hypothetical protein